MAVLGIIAVPSGSVARYALPAFPAYAGLAASIGRRATIALVALFMVGQLVFFAWTLGAGAIAP